MDLTNSPGHLNHQFAAEDAATLRPATEMTPNDMNGPMNELVNIILAAQIVPDANNHAQVLAALQALFLRKSDSVGKNKLLNTNFENPVNQLGKASRVTTAGAYNFDCWYYGADTKFYQAADYLNLSASQQYTLNWAGTATAEYLITSARSVTIEAQGGWTAIAKGAQLTTPADVISGAKFLWIRWTGVTSALATFDKPQLEEGTIATAYERKLYLQAFIECWSYNPFYSISAINVLAIGYAPSAVDVMAELPLLAPLRFPATGYVGIGGTYAFTDIAGAAVLGVGAIMSTNQQILLYATAAVGFAPGAGTQVKASGGTGILFTGPQI